MHVGVFLKSRIGVFPEASLPHARGGVSAYLELVEVWAMSSPCTWGCFLIVLYRLSGLPVFPMHVGVFLTKQIMQLF